MAARKKKKKTKKTSTKTAARKTRGSKKVIQEKGALLSSRALTTLKRAAAGRGVRVVDWCIYGQPAPDGFCGRFRVSPSVIRSTVSRLLALKEIREWKVLINGQPPAVLDYEISMQMGRHV